MPKKVTRRNPNEWEDSWTGKVVKTHFNPEKEPNVVLCREYADGGSMGYHHTDDYVKVTCKACRKIGKKRGW